MQNQIEICKANLLSNKNVNSKNKANDLKIKDKNNINKFIIDSYSYTIIIACKYQQKQNAIDFLKFFVLLYLYYSLYIFNYANKINHKIWYNLNILK